MPLFVFIFSTDLPVCDTVPHIAVLRERTAYPLQMTFLIDTEKVAISDLSVDNLGLLIISRNFLNHFLPI